MRLVVDANVLFSFFKRGSVTRKLITSPKLLLFAPAFSLRELDKHKEEVIARAKISHDAYEPSKKVLRKFVEFIPLEEYEEKLTLAKETSPDPKDIRYFALALWLDIPLWTNEKRLKRQDKVLVLSTSELLKMKLL
jgi:predicted nucleic acid-binding protein